MADKEAVDEELEVKIGGASVELQDILIAAECDGRRMGERKRIRDETGSRRRIRRRRENAVSKRITWVWDRGVTCHRTSQRRAGKNTRITSPRKKHFRSQKNTFCQTTEDVLLLSVPRDFHLEDLPPLSTHTLKVS